MRMPRRAPDAGRVCPLHSAAERLSAASRAGQTACRPRIRFAFLRRVRTLPRLPEPARFAHASESIRCRSRLPPCAAPRNGYPPHPGPGRPHAVRASASLFFGASGLCLVFRSLPPCACLREHPMPVAFAPCTAPQNGYPPHPGPGRPHPCTARHPPHPRHSAHMNQSAKRMISSCGSQARRFNPADRTGFPHPRFRQSDRKASRQLRPPQVSAKIAL